ncbi:MAG TPA: hypothetical protein VF193_00910 [Steroidobacter sp.]
MTTLSQSTKRKLSLLLMEALGVTELPDIAPNEEVNEPLPTAA